MKTYFGVIQNGRSFKEVKMRLTGLGIKISKYYPRLKIVKFETEKEVSEAKFDFFITIEEEKEDIFIQ